jgi:hypothetical protein
MEFSMKIDPFEMSIRELVEAPGYPAKNRVQGKYGISYWRRNQPSRIFESREEMERVRVEFIRKRGGRINLIRLARETKYYVNGVNVPNRV